MTTPLLHTTEEFFPCIVRSMCLAELHNKFARSYSRNSDVNIILILIAMYKQGML